MKFVVSSLTLRLLVRKTVTVIGAEFGSRIEATQSCISTARILPPNLRGNRLHFHSWRVNAGPGVWVPAYIYSAEFGAGDVLSSRIFFEAQTLL
jgi:hypothetical protein